MQAPLFPLPPGQLLVYPQPFVPVGSVLAFAGQDGQEAMAELEASGWMLCNGRTLDRNRYPELYQVIGFLYGGDNADHFAIPDYRGMFLRGRDETGTVDPDLDKRTAPGDSSQKSTAVGSVQQDALHTHVHKYKSVSPGVASPDKNVAGIPLKDELPTTGPEDIPSEKVSDHETRPVNTYVNFIIKFTHYPAWSGRFTNFPFHRDGRFMTWGRGSR